MTASAINVRSGFIRRMRSAAQRIVPAAWLIFMFSVSGFFVRRFAGPIPATWIGIIGVISAVVAMLTTRTDRPRPAALLPLVALTVTGAIANLFGVDPQMGTVYLTLWITLVLIWWQATLMPNRLAERATFAVLAAFGVLGIYETVIWAILYGAGPGGLILRPMVTFPSPNHLGAAMLAGMVLALKQKRWLWLAIMAIALALTGSRGAVLGAGAGVVIYGAWWLMQRGGDRRKQAGAEAFRPYRITRLVLMGGGVVALIGVALFAIQSENDTHAPPQYRLDLWQVAVHTFADHPLHGIGLENYKYGFLQYATLQHERIHEQAHSVPLQIAAEQGMIGLAALALLLIVNARTLIDLYRKGERERLMLASVLVAAMAVQGIFDYVYEVPMNALVVMLAAWVISRAPIGAHPQSLTLRVREARLRITALLIGIFIVTLFTASLTPVWPYLLMPAASTAIFLALGRDPLPEIT